MHYFGTPSVAQDSPQALGTKLRERHEHLGTGRTSDPAMQEAELAKRKVRN
jgi:hypothetical protein